MHDLHKWWSIYELRENFWSIVVSKPLDIYGCVDITIKKVALLFSIIALIIQVSI